MTGTRPGIQKQFEEADETTMTYTLTITGMNCGHCANAVREALMGVPGVSAAEVDLALGSATVETDDTVTAEALIAAVVEEGYGASTNV